MLNKDAATSLTAEDIMCVIGEVTVTLIERRLARLVTKPIASCHDAPASNRTDRQKSRCAYSNNGPPYKHLQLLSSPFSWGAILAAKSNPGLPSPRQQV